MNVLGALSIRLKFNECLLMNNSAGGNEGAHLASSASNFKAKIQTKHHAIFRFVFRLKDEELLIPNQ